MWLSVRALRNAQDLKSRRSPRKAAECAEAVRLDLEGLFRIGLPYRNIGIFRIRRFLYR
jgi:hypothetical protein